MADRLKDNLNSKYFEAANALRSKQSRRRIVAYVESYDDIYFWRTVLSRFETPKRYFEVMLPSHKKLGRGKKSVLMSFSDGRVGPDMIACVDADYDYVLQGSTEQSRKVLQSPYVFHTYAYAIENLQCYAPSLHDVCVAVTLNDHRIFDFEIYLQQYSIAIFPLFIWSVWFYRNGLHNKFSLSDFNRIVDIGGFNVKAPEASIANVRRKVNTKVRQLQQQYPGNKEAYLQLKQELLSLGITAETTYLYIQGHALFDTIVSPMLDKVCQQLRQMRQQEIETTARHDTQKMNEMSCYQHSVQDIKQMLRKNIGYQFSNPFHHIQQDLSRYLGDFTFHNQ